MAIKISEIMVLRGMSADRDACYITARDTSSKQQTHRLKLSREFMPQLAGIDLGKKIRVEGEYVFDVTGIRHEINKIKREE